MEVKKLYYENYHQRTFTAHAPKGAPSFPTWQRFPNGS